MQLSIPEQLERIRRGAVELITEDDLRKKLALKRPLVIKAGFDPTAPDLHLGHTVLLRKLRQFQDLGHTVVFLIGDATALVGDPSGQSKMRKLMTPEEVHANAATYHAQVQQILTVDDPKVYRQCSNSEWLGGESSGGKKTPFGLKELVELTSRYTVARLIERDDFQKRMKAGQEVSMLELFYPLMQGYDSVKLKADVELGGTDQKLNLLVGRDLQRAYGQEPQVVLTMPLLEGTDGTQKMSKSLGNHVGINESPGEMFGKLMSIPDTLIVKYFTLLTDIPKQQVEEIAQQIEAHSVNPMEIKANLAAEIVRIYRDDQAAQKARQEFFRVFSDREYPSEIANKKKIANSDSKVDLVDLIVEFAIVDSKNKARTLIKQGAVEVNNEKVTAPIIAREQLFPPGKNITVLRVGSSNFIELQQI